MAAGVFLDRDGTLNIEVDYLRTPDELRLIEGAAASVRRLNNAGLVTCVISNQSGVARGFLTEADIVPIHAKLRAELAHEGATLDGIYYCPHHPTAGIAPYNVDCDCRKPKPGMLIRASKEFNLDLKRSFVVGDSVVDIQAGIAVGATTILVQTGYGKQSLLTCREQNIPIEHVAESIVEATEFILDKRKGVRDHNE
ncbi:MAG: D-glycero-beta-D-manno-heptose 1,7-bisphosphate 7-phosphatase [Bacteroidetes bacterium]|nr:D-glycero-beta-D-manno-heptose 1,7-bisphosphate 7-phosphatase [Bacteroidota bacterium]MCW5894194.1 D-glycero-beta-D-manno-heptose 1,7-bisphosphate 7-phosphatase [Bacteroidota bacterium]